MPITPEDFASKWKRMTARKKQTFAATSGVLYRSGETWIFRVEKKGLSNS